MTRADLWENLRRALPHVFGLAAIALIVAGVWGKWGWEWAAMVAGAPPATFYLFGEIRAALGAQPRIEEEG